jgi:methionyl-tRNA synthetase
VYVKNEDTGAVEKISKSLGNVVEPMEIIKKFSADAFRYYFLRECPFPGDGEFGWGRFAEVFNSELANNLGNMLSRCLTLISKNYDGVLVQTAGVIPSSTLSVQALASFEGEEGGGIGGGPHPEQYVAIIPSIARQNIETCRYSRTLQLVVQALLTPTNQYLETHAPWKLVKSDKEAAKRVLFNAVQSLRVASILLKPFIPHSAEAIYKSFNFPTPWEKVTYADAAELKPQTEDLRVTAELVDGKVKPLFPRIG